MPLTTVFRLETVMKGREDREKFGGRKAKMNEHASTTNKQKLKNKNFMMLKHKLKGKAKKSFVQKQKDLKKSMIRSKKFK
jgi:protein SDA1